MKKHRLKAVAWVSILILVSLLIIGVIYTRSQIASIERLFPENSGGTSLFILSPGDESKYPADASIPIRVSAANLQPSSFLELWVDGRLAEVYDIKDGSSESYTHTFHWTPGTPGSVRLLVKTLTSDGSITGISSPIQLQIIDQSGMRLISAGDDLQQIGEIIYPLTSIGRQQLAVPNPSPSPNHDFQPANPLQENLALWLGRQISLNARTPEAPELSYLVKDCKATLIISDQSDIELGFFLYRSSPGSTSFKRVAELGKGQDGSPLSFLDPDTTPGAIYYAAAFNGAGESPSSPVMIGDGDLDCADQSAPESLDESLQQDFETLDLAYFYYRFDNTVYQRFPADPDSFLTPSEYPTSLKNVVEGLAQKNSSLVFRADIVVWGWKGGDLENLGAYQFEIDSSQLLVCNLGTECTGDAASGFRSTFGELANDSEDQAREFYWSTTSRDATAVLWQIATVPFPPDFSPHPYGLEAAGCSQGSNSGTFLVDFRSLDEYFPAPSSCGSFIQSGEVFTHGEWNKGIFPNLETHYYIRFTPMAGGVPAGKPSNTVEILAKPGESVIEPILADHLPEIYQVEIVDFSPIKNMDPQYWGCVFITGLDYQAIWNYYRSQYPAAIDDNTIDQLADKIYSDLNYAIQNNLIVCPAPYQGSSDSGSVLSEWGSMFVESLGEIWDSVVSAFNALKGEIVDLAAEAINQLGIPCDAECKAGLKLGLEIGIAYFTGVPPNLPSFEELADQGINYAVELAAAEAGIPCPDECQNILRGQLERVVDLAASNSSQPGCVDEDWANLLGKHSLCLPPGVETEAVPEGVSEPARAAVRITRTGQGDPGQYQHGGQPSYMVNISFKAENTQLAGKTIPYNYRYLDWDKGYQQFFTINVPVNTLQNDVFDSQSLPIPPLAPGESITIPLALKPHQYYIPEHLHSLTIELNSRNLELNDVGGIGGSRGALFDWLCLHNGARIKIEASVSCLSVPTGLIGNTSPDEDSMQVPCGSTAAPVYHQETSNACYP